MAAEYDEQGNYKYPEGFDPETNEWLEGYDAQREAWEAEYAAAHARWEAHKAQVAKALEEEQESGAPAAPRVTPHTPRLRRRPPVRWPLTRLWLPCARSSPATE